MVRVHQPGVDTGPAALDRKRVDSGALDGLSRHLEQETLLRVGGQRLVLKARACRLLATRAEGVGNQKPPAPPTSKRLVGRIGKAGQSATGGSSGNDEAAASGARAAPSAVGSAPPVRTVPMRGVEKA